MKASEAHNPGDRTSPFGTLADGCYANWRARVETVHTLAERSSQLPLREELLRLIWQYQRVQRDQLETADGQPIRVLHPGFWNREAGPDFKGAAIQIGQDSVRYGDVEVDLLPQGWQVHHHDINPAYRNVVLHVVWDATAPVLALPTLSLKARLDAPLDELELWLRQEPGEELAALKGRCAETWRNLPESVRLELLQQAGHARLRTKAGHLHARAKQVGWEQSLWEGLFGALGYKNNVWPMQRISEMLPVITADPNQRSSLFTLQVRLLGISGLLPSQSVPRVEASSYLRKVWDVWWREREQFADLSLPRTIWRLHGLRPANSPHRRLALAAHWLADASLPSKLERWFATAEPDSKLRLSLVRLLQTEEDAFWSRHWTLLSDPMAIPRPLIGEDRVTDLAINVILPWFWIRAAVGQNQSWQHRAEQCYFAWPKAQDNAILRLARQRLFGSADLGFLNTASLQQGLLQIVRDFCDYSNALCDNCPLPALLLETAGGQ